MSEARSKAEKPSDKDLLAAYRVDKDKLVVGRKIMTRVLAKAELSELAKETLRRRNGTVVTNDSNQPLQVINYLEVAGEHMQAEEVILGFLEVPETEAGFELMKEGMRSMVQMYVTPAGESGAAA